MKPEREPFFRLHEQLEIEASPTCASFPTHIVGIKTEQYLILDYPFSRKSSQQLGLHQRLWVRFFRQAAYRFESETLQIIFEPTPLLFLKYPQTIQEVKRRVGDRKKVFIRATLWDIQRPRSKPLRQGHILNISRSGCLMMGDLGNLLDRRVALRFQVPWSGETLRLEAQVVRCEMSEQGFLSGLKFVETDERTKQSLHRMLHSLDRIDGSRLVKPAASVNQGG